MPGLSVATTGRPLASASSATVSPEPWGFGRSAIATTDERR